MRKVSREPANWRHSDKDEIEGEPGQIELAVLDEVGPCLFPVRLCICARARALHLSHEDVDHGGNHVHVEAASLNDEPYLAVAPDRLEIILTSRVLDH